MKIEKIKLNLSNNPRFHFEDIESKINEIIDAVNSLVPSDKEEI